MAWKAINKKTIFYIVRTVTYQKLIWLCFYILRRNRIPKEKSNTAKTTLTCHDLIDEHCCSFKTSINLWYFIISLSFFFLLLLLLLLLLLFTSCTRIRNVQFYISFLRFLTLPIQIPCHFHRPRKQNWQISKARRRHLKSIFIKKIFFFYEIYHKVKSLFFKATVFIRFLLF